MKFDEGVDVITRINECYSRMSKGKKSIAMYICDHYEQAVFMTAAELGKIGGNLNQAVRNMNTSLKSGAKGVDPQDERMVRSCSDLVSVCVRGIESGIGTLKQIVKKL